MCINYFVETYDPCGDDNYRKHCIVDQQPCIVEALEIPQQYDYTALQDHWIRDCDAVILLYSICSRSSFEWVKTCHSQLIGKKCGQYGAHFPIFLVGNKCDGKVDREISLVEGRSVAKWLNCDHFGEVSAKEDDKEKIYEIFCDIVRNIRIVQKLKVELARSPSSPVSLPSRHNVQRKIIDRSTFKSLAGLFQCSRNKRNICIRDGIMDETALNSSLIYAIQTNDEQGVKRYLSLGTDLNGQPGLNGSAIHAAAANDHLDIVNILLTKGASINASRPGDTTPLQVAALAGHYAIVRLLLDKGARINDTSHLYGTALSAAASRAKPDVVRLLLERGADVHVAGGSYGNALRAAAVVGNLSVTKLLLSSGVVTDARH